MSHHVRLPDRGVVEVSGEEAAALLQRLLTSDILGLAPGEASFAALLTPQGKILVDFLCVRGPEVGSTTYLLDCPAALAADLARRLTLYRLRARVTIADRSDTLGVMAGWPEATTLPGIVFRDPRDPALGMRSIAALADLPTADPAGIDAYERHRLALGIPAGGEDYAYGDTFPHDAHLDRLHGVDFRKGCYIGQEVVSRVEHRGTARKRFFRVAFHGDAPPPGTPIRLGDVLVGTMGTGRGGRGLAHLRTDRLDDRPADGLSADGISLSLETAASELSAP